MRFIRQMAVARAMYVLSIMGFLAISLYGGIDLWLDVKRKQEFRLDQRLTDLSKSIGELTHELQKERGASAGFIASQGERFSDTLKEQRELSDTKIAAFEQALVDVQASRALDTKLSSMVEDVVQQIDALSTLRTDVDGLRVELLTAVGTITSINRSAIGLLPEIGKIITHPNAARAVQRHAIFMTAKDILGLERATGATGFALAQSGDKVFPAAVLARFQALGAEKQTLMSIYANLASTDIQSALEALQQSDASIEVVRLATIARSNDPDQVPTVDPQVWFSAITELINIVKSIEDQAADEIASYMREAIGDAQATLIKDLATIIAFMSIFVLLTVSIVRTMTHSLGTTLAHLTDMTDGDFDTPITSAPQKDLGQITASLEVFRQTEIERRETARKQTEIETSSAAGIKRVCQSVENGDFQHRLRLRDLTGPSLVLGSGVNEILGVAEKFVTEQRQKDLDLLEKTKKETEAQKRAAEDLNTVVQACSRGDFSKRMNTNGLDGAWEEVANGINRIASVTNSALMDIQRIMDAMSDGNLSARIDADYQGTFGQIQSSTNMSLDRLFDAFSDIRTSVTSIGDAAVQLQKGTHDLAVRSDQQAEIVESSKTATTQLNETIKDNRESLMECRTLMKSLAQQTERSQEVAGSAVGSMSAIETASAEVTQIVATIEDIAFQTNLLALNASVEAARAGEAGKGFSVVASEVRALANRCSTASSQISDLIRQSVEEVARGSENVKQTGHAIESMQEILGQVLGRIETVAKAGEEQLAGVSSLDSSIQTMDEASKSNRSLSLENKGLMETLSNLEASLSETLADFLDKHSSEGGVPAKASAA